MSSLSKSMSSSSSEDIDDAHEHVHDLRRGPWTLQEDTLLVHYITRHGEGRWNLLAKRAGLCRTGKSCRLRWLNYLKPDVKRGNLTPQEQILILDLHSKLGNKWSKIAQHLPGRTDNEIKNYWRTRVQKQARHLKVDANSQAFQEIVRCFWMPRLFQKIQTDQNSTISQPVNHIFSDNNSPLPPPPPENPLKHEPNSDSNSCISSNISQISQSSSSEYIPCFDSSNHGRTSYYNESNYYNMQTMNLENLSMSEGFENPIGESYMEDKDWVEYNFGENYTWDELMAI